MTRSFSRFLGLVLASVAPLLAQHGEPVADVPVEAPPRTHTWSAETLAALRSLPVQEGGRVKPLSAFAAATLHLVHGRRDMKLDTDRDGKDDVTLTPTEWLLDVWFHPDVAAHYPLFRIENVEVLDAIGLEHRGQTFGFEYVSFATMARTGRAGVPGRKLLELAHQYSRKEANQRSGVETHIVNSAQQVNVYYDLHHQMELLRSAFPLEGEELRAAMGGGEELDFTGLVERLPAFRALVREHSEELEDPKWSGVARLGAALQQLSSEDGGAALFPPTGAVGDSEVWLGFGGLLDLGIRGDLADEKLGMLRHLQRAVTAAQLEAKSRSTAAQEEDQAKASIALRDAVEHGHSRERELVQFRDAVVARATARGEFDRVEREADYLAANWHYRALHWFLLAILVVAAGWMAPKKKWLWVLGLVATALPLGMLTWDIVERCLIRQRPPIVNLHDTFLFIAAVGVLAAIVGEVIVRRRFILALAPIFGALLIALARAFEVEDGKDQLAPLIAVLDTNYYLATHVTSINIGYAAGMFGALIGTLWLLMQTFGIAKHDQALHKAVVRACYGVVAFGLIFAVFGTIYGGVWANDSWGRFWGWDPKENGALLICLAQVALLHARLCGWVRDLGFCAGAALTGIVVAFSWFHVNLLGIGLHSYGFASGLKTALFTYYGIQVGLILIGVVGTLVRRAHAAEAAAANATGGVPVAERG